MWNAAWPRKAPKGWIVRKPLCARTLRMPGSNCGAIWPGGNADVMKHPSEASLALFAGGDLGRLRRGNIERHMAACSECRHDISEFSALRTDAGVLAELPELSWDRLAAEMKANIRLGLEAGECVTEHTAPR